MADDVAQEVCIALLSALPRYRDMGRPFASFVFGIAAHKVADARRSAASLAIPTEDLPDTPDDRPGPEEAAVACLDELDRPAGRLALLVALAPYQVDETVIPEFRDTHPSGRELLAATAWASFTATRRVAGWLTPAAFVH